MKFAKAKILKFVAISWIVFSIFFVGKIIFDRGRNQIFNAGFENGLRAGISKVIENARNESCAYFPVALGEEKVELLNIECLQKISENSKNFEIEN